MAPLFGEAAQLLASLHTAFSVDVAQVILDRLAADEQLGRDLGIGQPLADQVGHLCLPAGQGQHRLLRLGLAAGKMALRQFGFGPGNERRGPQGREQCVGLAQPLDRVLAVAGAAQEPTVGSSSRAVCTGLRVLTVPSPRW
jgi:hypothetical protein